jgi:hypothetical protein
MNIDLMIYLLGNYEGFVFLIGLIGCVSSLTFILSFDCTTGIKQTRTVKFVRHLAFLGSFTFAVVFFVPTQETFAMWINEEIENTYTSEQIANSESLQRKIAYVRKYYSHYL